MCVLVLFRPPTTITFEKFLGRRENAFICMLYAVEGWLYVEGTLN